MNWADKTAIKFAGDWRAEEGQGRVKLCWMHDDGPREADLPTWLVARLKAIGALPVEE